MAPRSGTATPPRDARALAIALAIALAGCLPSRPGGEPAATVYHGLTPCRDCAGVATTLTLSADAYLLERRFLGRGAGVALERGTLKRRRSGAVRLFPQDLDAPPAWLRVDGPAARILALDGYGHRDDTTDAYVLAQAPPVRLGPGEREVFVDATRAACRRPDGGAGACLRVLRPEGPAPATWETLPWEIEGFAPAPGRLYHLVAREASAGEAPALVRIVSEGPDVRPGPAATYALASLGGAPVAASTAAEAPTLRLDPARARAHGTDGCNPYQARLKALGATGLEVGPLAGPRADCGGDSTLARAYRRALSLATAYRVDGEAGALELLDRRGATLATLRRVE